MDRYWPPCYKYFLVLDDLLGPKESSQAPSYYKHSKEQSYTDKGILESFGSVSALLDLYNFLYFAK